MVYKENGLDAFKLISRCASEDSHSSFGCWDVFCIKGTVKDLTGVSLETLANRYNEGRDNLYKSSVGFPQSLALLSKDGKYFTPLRVVETYIQDSEHETAFIRQNVVSTLMDNSDLIQVSTGFCKGYMAIISNFTERFRQEGLDSETKKYLTEWVRNTDLVANIFKRNSSFKDLEKNYFEKGRALSYGLASLALKEFNSKKACYNNQKRE